MGTVRFGLTGLAAQAVLLGLLAATVGLSAGGWAVGLAIVVATEALLGYALRRTHAATIGAANVVTFIRAALVATVAALVTDGETGPLQLRTTLTVTAIALALDAVDGQVARRTGSTSRVGSRFDGEVDALLILVLSVAVSHTAGWWVLAIGAWRYAFGAAGWVLPWLRRPLPPSRWRKTVAAVQGIMLAVALSGLLPHAVMVTALVGALILLSESFCHDVWWLWTRRPSARAQAPVARWRRITGAVVTTLAVAVMWGALVLPDHRSDLTLTSLLRVPIDGIVIVAVALMLPSRARWFLAFVSGGALATLTLARVLDVGFFYVLDRPFSPVTDWTSLDRAIRVLSRSIGHNKALLLTVVVIAVAALVLPAIALATARVTGAAARHPRASTKVIAGLAAVWTLCAALGVTTATGVPVASRSAAEAFGAKVRLVRADLRDQHEFNARLAAADTFGGAPAADLLPELRGKDVLLVFIESYGRVAVMGSAFAPHIDDLLRAGTARLHAAGYSSRSAYLESPTFGAGSWLAHSTLESGLWINNNGRYDELLASSRFTLSQAFKRAGWRTVFDLPATEVAWPDGQRFYRFDAMYGADNVGYKGPSFGFATIPDQYTLHALNQRELRTPDRPPLFAEVVLDSSHAPWTPLPHMVARRDLGHGRIFGPMARGQLPSTAIWSDSNRAKAAYAQSIDYTLSALISFLEQSRDKNLVVIALGDHQPYTIITGDQASHDVPITILARDRGVIDRISSWGWQGGLLPNPDAPVWRMDAFRDRFLAAYGPSPAPAVQARGSTP